MAENFSDLIFAYTLYCETSRLSPSYGATFEIGLIDKNWVTTNIHEALAGPEPG